MSKASSPCVLPLPASNALCSPTTALQLPLANDGGSRSSSSESSPQHHPYPSRPRHMLTLPTPPYGLQKSLEKYVDAPKSCRRTPEPRGEMCRCKVTAKCRLGWLFTNTHTHRYRYLWGCQHSNISSCDRIVREVQS